MVGSIADVSSNYWYDDIYERLDLCQVSSGVTTSCTHAKNKNNAPLTCHKVGLLVTVKTPPYGCAPSLSSALKSSLYSGLKVNLMMVTSDCYCCKAAVPKVMIRMLLDTNGSHRKQKFELKTHTYNCIQHSPVC